MDEKDKVNAYLKLYEKQMERFGTTQGFEWKGNFGVWALLSGAIFLVGQGHLSIPFLWAMAVLIVVVFLHLGWLVLVHSSEQADKELWILYRSEALKILKQNNSDENEKHRSKRPLWLGFVWKLFEIGMTIILSAILLVMLSTDNKYEVIERSEAEAANYQALGTHTEVHYVLRHGGHKIYATCDVYDLDKLDPSATCGFRPLRTYECALGDSGIAHGRLPLSDLRCKDSDDHNVYLYVAKIE